MKYFDFPNFQICRRFVFPITAFMLAVSVATAQVNISGSGVQVGGNGTGIGMTQLAGVVLAGPGTGLQTTTFAAIAADSFYLNNTGSSAAPAVVAIPNCPNGLAYSTSSHTFSCATVPVVPTVVDVTSTVAVSTTAASEFHYNENATAGTAVTYNLPTAAAGKQFCFSNAFNGSVPNVGVLTVATSATGQFIIFTDGTLSATGGNVTSGGAAADAACVAGVDSTHWMLYTQRGTWTKH